VKIQPPSVQIRRQVGAPLHLNELRAPRDKSEGAVMGKDLLCSAGAPRFAREVEDQDSPTPASQKRACWGPRSGNLTL